MGLYSYTIDIYGIGLVTLERSRRARRVIISVRPFKGVRVAVPARVSFRKAEAFLLSKTEWINKHLKKIKQFEEKKQIVRADFDDIDMVVAKETLTSRLEQLAKEHGFKYNRMTIRRQRTRWGSCSHKNNISLNARLVKLPDELRDYVILHELVHTRIQNHSHKFWAELDNYVAGARTMSRKLRTSGLELA